jgi:hypothetical protein
MSEIIGIKNGKIPYDYQEEFMPVNLMNAQKMGASKVQKTVDMKVNF